MAGHTQIELPRCAPAFILLLAQWLGKDAAGAFCLCALTQSSRDVAGAACLKDCHAPSPWAGRCRYGGWTSGPLGQLTLWFFQRGHLQVVRLLCMAAQGSSSKCRTRGISDQAGEGAQHVSCCTPLVQVVTKAHPGSGGGPDTTPFGEECQVICGHVSRPNISVPQSCCNTSPQT